jgi:hypothetical protein
MPEVKTKTPRKRGRPEDRERFKAVLLKSHAPQLFIDYIYPKSKNNPSNKFVVQIHHPNYFKGKKKKILWEKTYSAKTPIAKMTSEANERLKRLKNDKKNKTWVSGMEEFDKSLPQPGDQ